MINSKYYEYVKVLLIGNIIQLETGVPQDQIFFSYI